MFSHVLDLMLALSFQSHQDWTKLELDDEHEHQGLVEITYRSSSNNLAPPDVQAIQKQMAIVAWQPGPNRVLQVPSEVRNWAGQQVLNVWLLQFCVHNCRRPFTELNKGSTKSPEWINNADTVLTSLIVDRPSFECL